MDKPSYMGNRIIDRNPNAGAESQRVEKFGCPHDLHHGYVYRVTVWFHYSNPNDFNSVSQEFSSGISSRLPIIRSVSLNSSD